MGIADGASARLTVAGDIEAGDGSGAPAKSAKSAKCVSEIPDARIDGMGNTIIIHRRWRWRRSIATPETLEVFRHCVKKGTQTRGDIINLYPMPTRENSLNPEVWASGARSISLVASHWAFPRFRACLLNVNEPPNFLLHLLS